MVFFERLYQKFINPKFILHETSENSFSHRKGITVTTVNKISKIQEHLKVIPQVWSRHHCEVDYLHYNHVQKKCENVCLPLY